MSCSFFSNYNSQPSLGWQEVPGVVAKKMFMRSSEQPPHWRRYAGRTSHCSPVEIVPSWKPHGQLERGLDISTEVKRPLFSTSQNGYASSPVPEAGCLPVCRISETTTRRASWKPSKPAILRRLLIWGALSLFLQGLPCVLHTAVA